MGYALRAGISFCVVDGRAIFLDLVADRYFCAPARANEAFLALARVGTISDGHRRALEPLLAADVLRPAGSIRLTSPDIASPTERLGIDAGRCSATGVASAIIAQVSTAALLRARSLHHVLDRVARRARTLSATGGPQIAIARRRARDFAKTGMLFSSHDRCLFKSIALTRFLQSAGVTARLVIGVRASPFSAHSWVQLGVALLNDDLDHVRRFAPILVVG